MKDIDTALASLTGQAWGLISKLTRKGYDSTEAQFADMVRVGELAQSVMLLRQARRTLDAIPDKAPAAPAKSRTATTVATPEPKGPGITPLGQVTGDGKVHTVADKAQMATEIASELGLGYEPDLSAADALAEGMDLSGDDK